MIFNLIGDGQIAQYHKEAIKSVGGTLRHIYDPAKYPYSKPRYDVDYVVICSPSHTHRHYTKTALAEGSRVIVEKPMCLPWETPIEDDRINVVLQLRYMDLPKKANKVTASFVRDNDYFSSWKGDPKQTGGLLYNLFIHYIDLAILLGADFEGRVTREGKQGHLIDDKEIVHDYQPLYNQMYADIVKGKGIKPSDLSYLHWQMNRHSEIVGYGKNGLNRLIHIPAELL